MVYKGMKSEGIKVIYLYDVWVNWFEGEEQGYNVCQYHEWRKSDQIEVLEQVPVLYITESLFDYIENSLYDLPQELLDMIEKRTYKRKGHQREVVDFACIVSDGRGIIAMDTSGYQIPIRKSRLIPRQEQQVYDLCKKAKVDDFAYQTVEWKDEKTLISLHRKYMYGLTRKERQLKKILMIAMDQLKTSEDRSEVLYWLSEWDNKKLMPLMYHRPIKDIWQALYDDIKLGWGTAHEALCEQLIKGNPFLEKFWEKEQVHNNNSSSSR
jgi:hypothetical protein